jgi:uncharacterized protein (TIGR02646 family)
MVKVAKDFNHPPAILKSKRCKDKLKQALIEKNKHEVCKTCCGKEVKEALQVLYNDKCAYCECSTDFGAYLEIEHYRPKKRVKGKARHKGYYWLTYEWSNLLLTCQKCNKFKLDKFPLARNGKRVWDPIYKNGELSQIDCLANSKTLKAENPLLLHPEIDEPAEHFIFLPNGKMKGVTEYGKSTIKICKLNRKPLMLERKKIVDHFLNRIRSLIISINEGNRTHRTFKEDIEHLLVDLLLLQDPWQPYSNFACFMLENFELFFIKSYMEAEHQKMLIDIYESFIEKYL